MIIEHVLAKKQFKELITVHRNDTILKAAQLLAKNKIGALPVTSNGLLVEGIISERDIVKKIASNGEKALTLTVEFVMTKTVSTCTKIDTLKDVITRMNTGRFRHMPVLNEKEMIGFISISDLVLSHLNEVEFENNAMRGSVTGTM